MSLYAITDVQHVQTKIMNCCRKLFTKYVYGVFFEIENKNITDVKQMGFIAVLFNIRLLYHRFFVPKHVVLAA